MAFCCDFKGCNNKTKYNNFNECLRVRQDGGLYVKEYFLCHEHALLLERLVKGAEK
jgi:hypothetical protein